MQRMRLTAQRNNYRITNMNDTKQWWQSRAVWGALVAIAAPLVHLSVDDVGTVTDLVLMGAELIGGSLALYGRLAATKSVTTQATKNPMPA